MSYRCSKCRARRALNKRPEHYTRLPNCRHCRRTMTAYPTRRTEAHYVLDRYRILHERGRGMALCYPGRGGCEGYHFPHRRGSKFCVHSPSTTDQERAEREGLRPQLADDPIPF